MPATADSAMFGVDGLLELSGTDREAKAYAFLYAAFRRTDVSANPVKDALDCLTPFIAPYLNTIAGKQVLSDGIKQYMKSKFGFDVPLYAIDQLMPSLQSSGFVEYRKNVRIFVAKEQVNKFEIAKNEIEIQFDQVSAELSRYAREKGFEATPPSGTWGEALINFLKTNTERKNINVVNVKGALIDPGSAENAIVGGFIKDLNSRNPSYFGMLLNIFMGVLVEEFISSISEVGAINRDRPVNVFYDTAVLLRLLGCSGKLLRLATEELTRYLQDIGCNILYFPGNEAEVASILNAIIYVKDTGKELEGETADAISTGEVTITDIRMLQNTFTEKLALLNVFSAETIEGDVLKNAAFQIDERGFAEYLKQKALENRRARLIPLTQVRLYMVAALRRIVPRLSSDCRA